ncbi:universal stress protein [Saccharopolyspora rhizosphaerae]|uniref:Universal stress protein n=1 Tax=Saccharopolyspora rhizosphaerae TaxID=2492662 RepID=A0A426JLQ6_9PSEU|nr:universal stress protein [Saccharopolyspora rhizosphaerae]RRO14091.1 universal stress protein [Saccharopolyspora rhizosphaerae]
MTESRLFVVGVDGSEASQRALQWALREARERGAPVAAIMVWQSHAVLSGPAPLMMNPRLAPHEVRDQHWQELTRVVSECLAGASTPQLQEELVEGHPDEVLAAKSVHAAMLVLGDRGRGRVADAVLGSTALRCIHHARCPVLIIPSGFDLGEVGPETAHEAGDPVLG